MRVLSIAVVFPPAWHYGGPPVTAHAVAKAMIRRGHQVMSLCTGDRENDGVPVLDAETNWDGVPVVYCSRKRSPVPFYSPALRLQVASRIANYNIATIRSSWTHVGASASGECRRKGLPYLAYPEGNFEEWCMNRGRLKKAVFWRAYDKAFFEGASAIVALTRSEADSVRRIGLKNRVEVIPNGINTCDFSEGNSRAELERLFPKIKGRELVLFLGRIHPKKGLPELITAFKQIRCRHSDSLLVIAGPNNEGNYGREIAHFVEQEGLAGDVLFTGFVSGALKVGLLRNASVFVLPSKSEGFPMSVLEALACRLPVILTKGCNVPEVAEAGAGIETENSPQQIADALRTVLSNRSLREKMGEAGYELVTDRFSWDRVAQMTIDLSREVATC